MTLGVLLMKLMQKSVSTQVVGTNMYSITHVVLAKKKNAKTSIILNYTSFYLSI